MLACRMEPLLPVVPIDAEVTPDEELLPAGSISSVLEDMIVVQVGLQEEAKRCTANKPIIPGACCS